MNSPEATIWIGVIMVLLLTQGPTFGSWMAAW